MAVSASTALLSILVLPVFDGLAHFNPFSFLSSIPTVFQLQIKKYAVYLIRTSIVA